MSVRAGVWRQVLLLLAASSILRHSCHPSISVPNVSAASRQLLPLPPPPPSSPLRPG